MEKKYTFSFTQREVICMTNALGVDENGQPRQYRIGDGYILFGVLTQLRPIAALDSNIPEEQQAKQPPPEDPTEDTSIVNPEPAIIGTDADGEDATVN